jgi:acetyl-CoA carboxylase carboxyl transferase subunit alpha
MAHLDFEKPIVELEDRIRELKLYGVREQGFESELRKLEERVGALQKEIYDELSVWQKVQLSRHPDRPYFLDYLERLFDDFVELHGDRAYSDDAAIVSGFARLDGKTVAVIGHQKGRTTKEKLRRNFGMAHPEGYRKAMRVMELADRFRRPVLTFIDTPGAYPGIGAEERGQSEAIGQSLLVMSRLRVPVIATVIGEGGSGGALALGVANRVLMQEFATYSVITPEGCASILWRDGSRAPEAASQLKLLASNAVELGIVDGVVDEPIGGAHRDPDDAARRLGAALRSHLAELGSIGGDALVDMRYRKFRAMGVMGTVAPARTPGDGAAARGGSGE